MEKFKGTKKMVLLANLTAVAIILGLIENIYSISIVPGAKLGLANLITLVVLFIYSWKEAYVVALIRVFMIGIITGFPTPVFFMGLGGTILSVAFMSLFKLLRTSVTLTSLLGSISHQIGQILVAIKFFGDTVEIASYLVVMIPLGVVTGIVIGIVTERFLIHYKRSELDE